MMIDRHVIRIGAVDYLVVLMAGCLRMVRGMALENAFFLKDTDEEVVVVILAGDVMQYWPLAVYEDEVRLLIWLHTLPRPMNWRPIEERN